MCGHAGAARSVRRRVDGVLLLDKALGLTSNAALQRARHLYGAEKAGHCGTLDPLATGLLPLCLGEATKFAQTMLEARKEYLATVHFGIATATGDAEGEVIGRVPAAFSREDLSRALPRFVGRIAQIPPAFAALKLRGRAYYDYARAGIAIERRAREIEIEAIEIVDWRPPLAELRVACGKGTYIRVLAEDLGRALDSCAHLAALRRTASGPFEVRSATTLDALAALDIDARDALLLPPDAPLAELPRLDVDAATARCLVEGRSGEAPVAPPGRYRCYGPGGRFLGLVESAGEKLRSVRLTRTDAALER